MVKNMPKIPIAEGPKKALAAIKKFRNFTPSDKLVQIISEYEVETNKPPKKSDIAARDSEL